MKRPIDSGYLLTEGKVVFASILRRAAIPFGLIGVQTIRAAGRADQQTAIGDARRLPVS